MPVITRQSLAAGGPRRAQPLHPNLGAHQLADIGAGDVAAGWAMARISSNSAWRSSPERARSANSSVSRVRAADSRPDNAWSTSNTTSSSTSTTDSDSSVSRIG
jgi:hypothetical protein